ncbi:MAG: Flp pilus assembly protein, pilin Flp, pilin Flp [Clostridia bacterium 62_21]|nr:MAG: Flp pilus assembly protein, pilin Flp, pilin Flp [Clostridia bacterium 62_21]HAG07478.1 Flp family type IVb pilin [Peptococcaceae bacterium]
MRELARKLWRQEEGQALAEYGLILAIIAVAAIVALWALSDTIKGKLEEVNTGFSENPGS